MNITTADDIRDALRANRDITSPYERHIKAKHLVKTATDHAEDDLAAKTRLELAETSTLTGDTQALNEQLAKLAHIYDQQPQRYREQTIRHLAALSRHAIENMIDDTAYSIHDITTAIHELSHRYGDNGKIAANRCDTLLALHLGHTAKARKSHRDNNTSRYCDACDHYTNGNIQSALGDTTSAIIAWTQASTDLRCEHSPLKALAETLIALVQAGDTNTARAHHLRGYRGIQSKQPYQHAAAIGRHIEFCALTGNIARGLDIYHAHVPHLNDAPGTAGQLSFREAALILMRYLPNDDEVSGPLNRTWTSATLAEWLTKEIAADWARFDKRNDTNSVSVAGRQRIDTARVLPPVLLGLRHNSRFATETPQTATATDSSSDIEALIELARELDETAHPKAAKLWNTILAKANNTGTTLDDATLAAIAENKATTYRDPASALESYLEAASLHIAAGDHIRSLQCRSYAATHLAQIGDIATAERQAKEVCAEADTIEWDSHNLGIQYLILTSPLKIRLLGLRCDETNIGAYFELISQMKELRARFNQGQQTSGILTQHAEIAMLQASLHAQLDDLPLAVEQWQETIDLLLQARRPWYVIGPAISRSQALLQLSQLDEAEECAIHALSCDTEHIDPIGSAQLHLGAAQAQLAQGKSAEVIHHAVHAGHWYERLGQAEAADYTRYLLGAAYYELGQPTEAAAVLEGTIDRLANNDPDTGISARSILGQSLAALGENKAAATQFLLVAQGLSRTDNTNGYARAVSLAAEALRDSNQTDDALHIYREAENLWVSVGDLGAYARVARARSWLSIEEGGASLKQTREDMTAVADALAEAVGDISLTNNELVGYRQYLQAELGRTKINFALMISFAHNDDLEGQDAAVTEICDCLEQATVIFSGCGNEATKDLADTYVTMVRVLASARLTDAALDSGRTALTKLTALRSANRIDPSALEKIGHARENIVQLMREIGS